MDIHVLPDALNKCLENLIKNSTYHKNLVGSLRRDSAIEHESFKIRIFQWSYLSKIVLEIVSLNKRLKCEYNLDSKALKILDDNVDKNVYSLVILSRLREWHNLLCVEWKVDDSLFPSENTEDIMVAFKETYDKFAITLDTSEDQDIIASSGNMHLIVKFRSNHHIYFSLRYIKDHCSLHAYCVKYSLQTGLTTIVGGRKPKGFDDGYASFILLISLMQ